MSESDKKKPDDNRTESIPELVKDVQEAKLKRIGPFRIDRTLGTGGTASVFEAYDESMKRTIALKVLHPSLDLIGSTQERFAREAWIAGQLDHPNIIKVHTRGEEQGLKYLVMELASGGSLSDQIKHLRKVIQAGSDLSNTVSREYMRVVLKKFIELASALEHIHAGGFIHRDIKPHNILISGPEKQYKFSDFGIAHSDDMTKLTRAGDFMGTVKYMSPEQLAAHRARVDERSDIYSLGVTLYEALTLSLPYKGDSEERFMTEVLSGHSIPARRFNKRLPRDLETVLMTAMHHDPDSRYQNAAEFAADLRRCREAKPVRARREGIVSIVYKYGKRNWRLFVMSLAVGCLLATAFYLLNQRRTRALDNERIVQTLQTAVRTGESPYDIEPDWERLSEVLYRKVKSRHVDSAVTWYFRACAVPKYDYRKYSRFSKEVVRVKPFGVDVFNPNASIDDYSIVSVTKLAMSMDTSSWHPGGDYWALFGQDRPEREVSVGGAIRGFSDSATGLRQINVRRITEFFVGAGLYCPISDFRDQSSQRGSGWILPIDTIGARVVIDAEGDSLIERKLGTLLTHVSSFGRDYAPEIRRTRDLKVATATYVDTALDTFSVFVFNEYPDGYPQEIMSHSRQDWTHTALYIAGVSVAKRRYGVGETGCNIHLRLRGAPADSILIPIVGRFTVVSSPGRQKLLTGLLQVMAGNWGYMPSLKLSFDGKIIPASRTAQGDEDCIATVRLAFIPDFQVPFDELVKTGGIAARLEISPSIEVARFFGDVDEFWGHALVYDIEFQAWDSMAAPPDPEPPFTIY